MQSPPASESAVDAAIRLFGETVNMFDPLRFRTWAEMGLTTAQLRVLFLVRETPGVTAGELATRLGVTPPTISGIVDRLVKARLIRREDDDADRRLVRNFLTEQGEAACSRLETGSEVFTRRILIEMNHEDLEALVRGLKAFVAASEYVQRVEPDLAAVAMPGVNLQ
ncbi:MarR family winged helix-turn-helix transcriptional regulator [Tepidiforma sp.]|uniref:MarR family winged helix-turn-helix transcriptional regulator n=1 Tax=Tepidiforma sp. TaxID=2682230 RepID=UPI002ADE6AB0|nr:MarR family winged helix-turn-helix transcriptional regulator [Tepidiforma sp.]